MKTLFETILIRKRHDIHGISITIITAGSFNRNHCQTASVCTLAIGGILFSLHIVECNIFALYRII